MESSRPGSARRRGASPGARRSRTAANSDASRARPSTAAVMLLVFWFVVFGLGSIWWSSNPSAQFLTLGAAASFIVTIPAIRAQYHLFSAWTIVVLVTYVGCGVRSAFISLGIDDQQGSLQSLFLLGRTPDFFLKPSIIYVASVGVLTLAYLVGSYRRRPDDVPSSWWQEFRFRDNVVILACLLALVGFFALLVYVRETGGFHITDLSRKRTTVAGGLDQNYQSYGVIRVVNSFSAVALWVVVAHFASQKQRLSLSRLLLIAVLALNAIALPFYASSRTSALLILLIAWTISRVLSAKPVSYRKIAIVSLVGTMLLGLMTLLRQIAQRSVATQVQVSSVFYTALDGIIYNRNFGDMQVTSHVINAIPDLLPYEYGRTILTWFVAPIPRSIWPEKPVVNVGPLIGTTLYGTTGSGVPPGFVADFYLNFGVAGALLGSLVLGLVIGRIGRFRIDVGLNPGQVVLYYSFAFAFTNASVENGIGAGLFTGLESAVPAAIGVLMLGTRTGRSASYVARRARRMRRGVEWRTANRGHAGRRWELGSGTRDTTSGHDPVGRDCHVVGTTASREGYHP